MLYMLYFVKTTHEVRSAAMPISTVSMKGQITLPAGARRRVGIRPHDRVLIEVEGDKILVRPAPDFARLSGFLGKSRSPSRERQAMAEGLRKHLGKSR
jgi:AbrB family looped-hinge helix DNA binding protein